MALLRQKEQTRQQQQHSSSPPPSSSSSPICCNNNHHHDHNSQTSSVHDDHRHRQNHRNRHHCCHRHRTNRFRPSEKTVMIIVTCCYVLCCTSSFVVIPTSNNNKYNYNKDNVVGVTFNDGRIKTKKKTTTNERHLRRNHHRMMIQSSLLFSLSDNDIDDYFDADAIVEAQIATSSSSEIIDIQTTLTTTQKNDDDDDDDFAAQLSISSSSSSDVNILNDKRKQTFNSKFPKLPPWLQRRKRRRREEWQYGDEEETKLKKSTTTSSSSFSTSKDMKNDDNSSSNIHSMIQDEIDWLEYVLQEHHDLAYDDVSTIIKAIYICASGDTQIIFGCIDFLKLLIGLETNTNNNNNNKEEYPLNLGRENGGKESTTTTDVTTDINTSSSNNNMLVTKDVLLASVLHYTECVNARVDGIYQRVEKAFFQLPAEGSERDGASSSISTETQHDNSHRGNKGNTNIPGSSDGEVDNIDCSSLREGEHRVFSDGAMSLRRKLATAASSSSSLSSDEVKIPIGFDFFTPESIRLAAGASQIKRAEILVDVVLMQSRAITKEEYSTVRDLLVSVMEDWRSLAIRCVASLYRLEGLLQDDGDGTTIGGMDTNTNSSTCNFKKRSFAVTLAARNSIRVYANLAQRIGLHRLKTQLEAGAFMILYPRQYAAVSSLFEQKGLQMQYIAAFLTDQIEMMLNEDPIVLDQLDRLVVSSRVKEPYSFWKKILKKRKKQLRNGKRGGFLSPSSKISVIDVQDGVALRVIMKARKLSPNESAETTRRREEMLCYYVHHLIRSRWPAIDECRVKDYINSPKPNGYQSLHHTSKIVRNGQEFPFEVQVRSEEMHKIAEYGVAAHFDYKHNIDGGGDQAGPKATALLPPSSSRAPSRSDSDSSDDKKQQIPSTSAGNNSKYIDALDNARHALVRSNVYVFLGVSPSLSTGTGQLVTLPRGAQIADLLDELEESEIGSSYRTLQVWRNGQLALLNEIVGNGDVVVLSPRSAATKTTRERRGGDVSSSTSCPMLPPAAASSSIVGSVV